MPSVVSEIRHSVSILSLHDLLLTFDIVDHLNQLRVGVYIACFCTGSLPSFKFISSWSWLGKRDLTIGPYNVGCHRVWCFLFSFPESTWSYWLSSSIAWSEVSSLMILNYIFPSLVNVSSQFLKVVRVWMGNNRVQVNPGKTEQFSFWGPTDSRIIPSFMLDEVALPES